MRGSCSSCCSSPNVKTIVFDVLSGRMYKHDKARNVCIIKQIRKIPLGDKHLEALEKRDFYEGTHNKGCEMK